MKKMEKKKDVSENLKIKKIHIQLHILPACSIAGIKALAIISGPPLI